MNKAAVKSFSRLHGFRIYQRFLSRTQHWAEVEREAFTLHHLRQVLVRAGEGTRYYRDLFGKLGFDPRVDLTGAADLAGLPLLTKDQIRAHYEELIDRRFYRFSIPAETSGTTGEPLRMRLNEGFVAFDNACIFRHWSWAGYRWRAPMVALRSYVPASPEQPLWRYVRSQNTLFFSAYHLTPDNCDVYLEKILEFQPEFIKAYPSSMTVLAEYAHPIRGRFDFLKGIFTSSETLLPTERAAIERTFGRKVFNWYGMTEPAAVITECEAHQGMHLNWEYGYTELLPAAELPPDEFRIVTTGFHNPVMPFIRYDTGDLVRLAGGTASCACGRTMPLVETVLGRKDECIVTPAGRRLPSVNFYTVFRKYSDVLRFQIVQFGRQEVVVKVLPRPSAAHVPAMLERLKEELRARVGPEVLLELEVADRFLTNPDGKAPPILRRPGSRSVEEREEYRISSQQAWQAQRAGQRVHKLDWNESDRVPVARVREVLHRLIDSDPYLCWYPDARSEELRSRLADYVGLLPQHVLLVHGSDSGMDLIATAFVRPGDRVLLISPTYDHFRSMMDQRGAELDHFPYFGQTSFPLDHFRDTLARRAPRLVYLTNPNNPIGYCLSRETAEAMHQACAAMASLLVVDEAYYEFAGVTLADRVADSRALVVARSFSKAFGLAGLRLGCLLAGAEVMRVLERVHNPKSVTMLAQAAAAAALGDLQRVRDYLAEVRAAKECVYRFFDEQGVPYYPSEANFVLFRCERSLELVDYLAGRHILVRDRSAYFAGVGHVRVTLNGLAAAEAFLAAMRDYLAQAGAGAPSSSGGRRTAAATESGIQ